MVDTKVRASAKVIRTKAMIHQSFARSIVIVAACVGFISPLQAQQLYKHTDKDGKVTYSDKAPKQGEKAEAVNVDRSADKNANTVKLNTKDSAGNQQKFSDIKARGDAKAEKREKLQASVSQAELQVAAAKKALEDGRDPRPSEQRIVVRPGGNSVFRTEEYYKRIEGLEAAVKRADDALSVAQDRYRRGAGD